MGLFDRRMEKAADGIIKRIEAEDGEKGKYGNPIVVWVISAILSVVIRKLLERIIENDGEDIKNLAHAVLAKMEDEDA
jgi:RNA binding exosome subunit